MRKKLPIVCDFRNQLRTLEGEVVCQQEHFKTFKQVLKFLEENKALYEFMGMTYDTEGGQEIKSEMGDIYVRQTL